MSDGDRTSASDQHDLRLLTPDQLCELFNVYVVGLGTRSGPAGSPTSDSATSCASGRRIWPIPPLHRRLARPTPSEQHVSARPCTGLQININYG